MHVFGPAMLGLLYSVLVHRLDTFFSVNNRATLLLRGSNDLSHQAELKNGYLVRQDITKHDKT